MRSGDSDWSKEQITGRSAASAQQSRTGSYDWPTERRAGDADWLREQRTGASDWPVSDQRRGHDARLTQPPSRTGPADWTKEQQMGDSDWSAEQRRGGDPRSAMQQASRTGASDWSKEQRTVASDWQTERKTDPGSTQQLKILATDWPAERQTGSSDWPADGGLQNGVGLDTRLLRSEDARTCVASCDIARPAPPSAVANTDAGLVRRQDAAAAAVSSDNSAQLVQRQQMSAAENFVAQWTGSTADCSRLQTTPAALQSVSVAPAASTSTADDQWYYCDPQGHVQGTTLSSVL